jgi:hypothetical protein
VRRLPAAAWQRSSSVTQLASPLELDGWLEFNERKWGVRAERVRYPDERGPLSAVLYLNRRGRVQLPHLNPYLPVRYDARRSAPYRAIREWNRAADAFALDLRQRGLAGTIAFPPSVRDLRAWTWHGFRVGVRYTLIQELPVSEVSVDPAMRRRARRAARAGYRCERTDRYADVLACLSDTEERQRFRYGLTLEDLRVLHAALGDGFRTYICYDPLGNPAAARLVLHSPDGEAIDWVNGIQRAELASGAAPMLILHVLDDLAGAGAHTLDWEGANIPSIAAAKERWGGRIETWFTVEPFTAMNLARWIYAQFRYR